MAGLLERLLPTVPESLYHRQGARSSDAVRLTYLGTAGFIIEDDDRTLVLDPFITRPDLLTTALFPLVPNPELVRAAIPRADDVLIGHAHHDHILDGPILCRQTGARLIGSPDACNVGRAAGLPEHQLVSTRGREDIASGAAIVRGIPSLHGKAIAGRVPLPGYIPTPPPWPAQVWHLRHGLVLNWHLTMSGLRVVHIDSADFFDDELDGLTADVVCLCAIGRRYRPDYVETVVEKLQPRVIVACHWDWFFTPYDATPRCIPGVDLPGFVHEIERCGVEPIILPFGGTLGLNPTS